MIGVVAALAREARCLSGGRRSLDAGVLVEVSGAGAGRAQRAAASLIARGAKGLASFGVAGGLDPALGPGDLVLARAVRTVAGQVLPCDAAWLARLGTVLSPVLRVSQGVIAEAAEPIAATGAKALLFRDAGAVATDMESAAVAKVAAAAGLPFAAIRAIVDPADLSLPSCTRDALADGSIRVLAVLRGLARRPGEIRALLRLAAGLRAALRTLRVVARSAGPSLAFSG